MKNPLDTIIDRYAVAPDSTRPTFRPFTKEDWSLFGGCESAEPRIFEGDELVVVLDGCVVSVLDIETSEDERIETRDELAAEQIAAPIAAADDFETARELIFAHELACRGFELAGTFYRRRVGHSHEIVARSKKDRNALPHSYDDIALCARVVGDDDDVFDWLVGSRFDFAQGVRELSASILEVEAES